MLKVVYMVITHMHTYFICLIVQPWPRVQLGYVHRKTNLLISCMNDNEEHHISRFSSFIQYVYQLGYGYFAFTRWYNI